MSRKTAGLLLAALYAGVATMAYVTSAEEEKRRWRERDAWQNVPAIFAAMGVRPGSRVADVGSGDGYLSVRLARAVGERGAVYAVDVDEDALRRLRENLAERRIGNVEVVRGESDDPRLPAGGLDAAVIVQAYHEMEEHEAMLRHLLEALEPGGRLVVVDAISAHRRGASRRTQTRAHELDLAYARDELEAAGFEVLEARDPFVTRPDEGDEMWLLTARRPRRERSASRALSYRSGGFHAAAIAQPL